MSIFLWYLTALGLTITFLQVSNYVSKPKREDAEERLNAIRVMALTTLMVGLIAILYQVS